MQQGKGRKIAEAIDKQLKDRIESELDSMKFIKNFRSATAEEWYIFLPGFRDIVTGGAAGKTIIHYNLYGNRDVVINTTVIFVDPRLFEPSIHQMVYALADEIVNRLVGYADTLLSVHSGQNSYQAEYVAKKE